MNSKLLTIVTVTKNCVGTLSNTFESICKIKTDDIEYLVIDGLSTDGTLDLIHNNSSLIDKLISEQDDGIYSAMNKAVNIACGKYILFINGDDEIIPDEFKSFFYELANQDDDILSCLTIVDSNIDKLSILKPIPWKLLFINSIPHPSTFVKLEIMKQIGFREDLKIASDYDFFLQAFLLGLKFKLFNFSIALHKRGGASSNSSLSISEMRLIRRHRLGLYFYVLNTANVIYGLFKRLWINH